MGRVGYSYTPQVEMWSVIIFLKNIQAAFKNVKSMSFATKSHSWESSPQKQMQQQVKIICPKMSVTTCLSYSPTGGWLDKIWYTYRMQCYTINKKNDSELYWLKWEGFYKVLLRQEKYIKYLHYDDIFVKWTVTTYIHIWVWLVT